MPSLLTVDPLTLATAAGSLVLVLGGLGHVVFRAGRLTQKVEELERKVDSLIDHLEGR